MATNNRICLVNACEKRSVCRGMCRSHYMRWLRHGNPTSGRTEEGKPADFIRQVMSSPASDACVYWPFAKTDGRGQIYCEGILQLAHRVVCTLAHGKPPFEKAHAAHSCGKGHLACVNPMHLRWATCEENAADRIIHGTDNRGVKNHRSKLTEADVVEIKKMITAGESLASIARSYSVCPATIGHIKARNSWVHINGD